MKNVWTVSDNMDGFDKKVSSSKSKEIDCPKKTLTNNDIIHSKNQQDDDRPTMLSNEDFGIYLRKSRHQ